MAIRKIARLGHPILRQIAEPVPRERIRSVAVQRLIADLLDTVEDADGAGLAAPQIHEPLRVVVLRLDDEAGMRVWINPEITVEGDEQAGMFEGCLSVPGLRGYVSRPAAIEVKAWNERAERVHLRLKGFPAIVAQHECDHLDGLLYVDKVEARTLSYLEEHRKYGPLSEEDDDEPGDEGAEGGEE